MEVLLEKSLVYTVVILLCTLVVFLYLRKQRRDSRMVEQKIAKAKADGLYEPVTLHPVVDPNACIKTGACILACPEHDILGIVNGKATTINASRCIGHGACFHACPTQAITLRIGTEKRGVDLPEVNQHFETNVPGIYIAGELGGMGLIKNAVEQGKQAVDNIVKSGKTEHKADYDLIVVGAGPAGISASLAARKHKLKCLTLEQDTLGGTVFTFPRSKIVMTSPMEIPLVGKIKLLETSKSQLLELWQDVIRKHSVEIRENTKVESVSKENDHFKILTHKGETFLSKNVILAIGRRGSPRKLGVPGENLEKVAYRLLEPEDINGRNILIVGGGDSAIEAALGLAEQNKVTLSYRNDSFSRIKPKNLENINKSVESGLIDLKLNSNVEIIEKENVRLICGPQKETVVINNDLVYIFAGGELPTDFLVKTGIEMSTKYGHTVLSHK